MLENTNDYLSIIATIAIFIGMLAIVLYVANLRIIKINLSKEIKYYDYEKKQSD